jgi:hypothetical protein
MIMLWPALSIKALGVCTVMEALCMMIKFMELGDVNDKNSWNIWEDFPLCRSGRLKPGDAGLTTQELVVKGDQMLRTDSVHV